MSRGVEVRGSDRTLGVPRALGSFGGGRLAAEALKGEGGKEFRRRRTRRRIKIRAITHVCCLKIESATTNVVGAVIGREQTGIEMNNENSERARVHLLRQFHHPLGHRARRIAE
jgi:hypothetical protein